MGITTDTAKDEEERKCDSRIPDPSGSPRNLNLILFQELAVITIGDKKTYRS